MQTFENTVTIRRPAGEVFAYLAHFENIPEWNYAIDDTSKASAGPVGVGTRYRQTRSVPRRDTEEFEVTVFQPAAGSPFTGRSGPSRQPSATSWKRRPARQRWSTPWNSIPPSPS